ncbi:MAG: acyl-CoA synthetase [Acidimicrobiia bacterium]
MGSFWNYAAETPDALGLVEPDGTTWTAGALHGEANRLVHALRDVGVAHGECVAMLVPNGVVPWALYLAVLQAGWYLTPVNYHLTAPEVACILRDSEAKAFVAHERFGAVARDAAIEADVPISGRIGVGAIDGFRSYEGFIAYADNTPPNDRCAGATMHYTSGTTGRPKGVRRDLSESSPDEVAEITALLLQLFGVQPRDNNVHLVTSPNYHTAVTTFAGASLQLGHALVLQDKWHPAETLELIEQYSATVTHMVPTHFVRMLGLPEASRAQYDVSSMRYAIHAAAPCPVDIKRRMLEWWGPVIYEYYAATEGGGTIATPQDWLAHPGTVGVPWPVSEVAILDDDGNPCATRTEGTVYMKMALADFVYKDDLEKTNANRVGEFFTVGDIGYLDEDGFLFLCDRKADMIIAGGVNIYPTEIENELLSHPKVGDAAVFGIPDDDLGEQVMAVIEPAPGIAASDELAAELLTYLEGRLAHYKWPRRIEFSDALPRDPSGKLYKRRLRDPYWEGHERRI